MDSLKDNPADDNFIKIGTIWSEAEPDLGNTGFKEEIVSEEEDPLQASNPIKVDEDNECETSNDVDNFEDNGVEPNSNSDNKLKFPNASKKKPKVSKKNPPVDNLLGKMRCSHDSKNYKIVKKKLRCGTCRSLVCPECCKVMLSSLQSHFSGSDVKSKDIYKCKKCSMAFHSVCSLQAHIRVHSMDTPYVCPDCGLIYNNIYFLILHLINKCFHVHKIVRYKCQHCIGCLYFNIDRFVEHIKKIHLIPMYRCSHCSSFFKTPEEFNTHLDPIHQKLKVQSLNCYRCTLCSNVIIPKFMYQSHIDQHRDSSETYDISFQCVCGVVYASIGAFRNHIQQCSKKGVLPSHWDFLQGKLKAPEVMAGLSENQSSSDNVLPLSEFHLGSMYQILCHEKAEKEKNEKSEVIFEGVKCASEDMSENIQSEKVKSEIKTLDDSPVNEDDSNESSDSVKEIKPPVEDFCLNDEIEVIENSAEKKEISEVSQIYDHIPCDHLGYLKAKPIGNKKTSLSDTDKTSVAVGENNFVTVTELDEKTGYMVSKKVPPKEEDKEVIQINDDSMDTNDHDDGFSTCDTNDQSKMKPSSSLISCPFCNFTFQKQNSTFQNLRIHLACFHPDAALNIIITPQEEEKDDKETETTDDINKSDEPVFLSEVSEKSSKGNVKNCRSTTQKKSDINKKKSDTLNLAKEISHSDKDDISEVSLISSNDSENEMDDSELSKESEDTKNDPNDIFMSLKLSLERKGVICEKKSSLSSPASEKNKTPSRECDNTVEGLTEARKASSGDGKPKKSLTVDKIDCKKILKSSKLMLDLSVNKNTSSSAKDNILSNGSSAKNNQKIFSSVNKNKNLFNSIANANSQICNILEIKQTNNNNNTKISKSTSDSSEDKPTNGNTGDNKVASSSANEGKLINCSADNTPTNHSVKDNKHSNIIFAHQKPSIGKEPSNGSSIDIQSNHGSIEDTKQSSNGSLDKKFNSDNVTYHKPNNSNFITSSKLSNDNGSDNIPSSDISINNKRSDIIFTYKKARKSIPSYRLISSSSIKSSSSSSNSSSVINNRSGDGIFSNTNKKPSSGSIQDAKSSSDNVIDNNQSNGSGTGNSPNDFGAESNSHSDINFTYKKTRRSSLPNRLSSDSVTDNSTSYVCLSSANKRPTRLCATNYRLRNCSSLDTNIKETRSFAKRRLSIVKDKSGSDDVENGKQTTASLNCQETIIDISDDEEPSETFVKNETEKPNVSSGVQVKANSTEEKNEEITIKEEKNVELIKEENLLDESKELNIPQDVNIKLEVSIETGLVEQINQIEKCKPESEVWSELYESLQRAEKGRKTRKTDISEKDKNSLADNYSAKRVVKKPKRYRHSSESDESYLLDESDSDARNTMCDNEESEVVKDILHQKKQRLMNKLQHVDPEFVDYLFNIVSRKEKIDFYKKHLSGSKYSHDLRSYRNKVLNNIKLRGRPLNFIRYQNVMAHKDRINSDVKPGDQVEPMKNNPPIITEVKFVERRRGRPRKITDSEIVTNKKKTDKEVNFIEKNFEKEESDVSPSKRKRKLSSKLQFYRKATVPDDEFSSGQVINKSVDSSKKCAVCKETFSDASSFREHIVSHRMEDNAYQCMECGECFVVRPSLEKHLHAFHKIKNTDKYISENECSNVKKEEPEEPVESEPLKENQCKVCKDQFERAIDLTKHFRIHGMAFLREFKKDGKVK